MKICSKCKIEKDETSFHRSKRAPGGRRAACNSCEKIYSDNYNRVNRDMINERNKAYKKKNRDLVIQRSRLYYQNNKKECAVRTRKWRDENRELFNEISKNLSKKYYSDPFKRARTIIRNRVSKAFNYHGWIKGGKTESLLGADFKTVTAHIERQFKEGMTWENNGRGENCWHIDHKIPISSAKTEEELISLCHYTNLQPLWEFDNLSKNNKIINPIQTTLTI